MKKKKKKKKRKKKKVTKGVVEKLNLTAMMVWGVGVVINIFQNGDVPVYIGV